MHGVDKINAIECVGNYHENGVANLVGKMVDEPDRMASCGQVNGFSSQIDRRTQNLVFHFVDG